MTRTYLPSPAQPAPSAGMPGALVWLPGPGKDHSLRADKDSGAGMGVCWWWGWEMRWHMGGSSTCLLSTWQELEVRSCHSSSAHPPSPCATPSSSTALGRGWYLSWQNPLLVADCFSPSSAGILHGEVGQQDLPEPSAQWVRHALGSQSCGGQIEQRKRSGYQLFPGMDSSRNPGQTQKAGD